MFCLLSIWEFISSFLENQSLLEAFSFVWVLDMVQHVLIILFFYYRLKASEASSASELSDTNPSTFYQHRSIMMLLATAQNLASLA
jgi:hypothetical protein